MPTYVLTGVDGQLSSIAATYALTLAQPADTLIFTSPRPAFIPSSLLTACAARNNNNNNDGNGPTIRILMVNYNDPANLVRAFAGADVVAFVSSPNYLAGAARRAQHRNVVEAAQRAGIGRLVYTSLVGAAELGEGEMGEVDESDAATTATASALMGARDHAYTERLVRESGRVWNIQRNGLFVNSFLCEKEEWNNHAAFVAREDCGRVLGALLMGKGEPNRVYTVYGAAAARDNANKNEGAARGATAMPLSPPASPVSDEANHSSRSKSGVARMTPVPNGHGRRLSAGASRHGDFFGRYGHADATAALEEEEEEGLVLYGRYVSSELGHLLEGGGEDAVRVLTGREPVSLFRGEMLNSPISPTVVTASERREEEEKFTRELCCG